MKIPTFKKQKQAVEVVEVEQELPEDGHELQMGFFEHLDELRSRFVKAFLAVIVGTLFGLLLATPTLDFIRQPYCEVTNGPENCELVILGPTGGVVAYFRVSLMIGGVIAVPAVTYQLMLFILPGLTRKEKRYVLLSLPAITLLFILGSAFAWFVLMRPALGFLEGFQPMLFEPEWTADLYLGFVTSLVFWMGVAFETPLVFFVLSLFGLVTPGLLIQNWRIAVIASAVAAAMITPTIDPVNMFLVMGPLMTLYALSIVLVMLGNRFAGVSS